MSIESRRNALIRRYALWDGDPQTEPDGELEDELDRFDEVNDTDDTE